MKKLLFIILLFVVKFSFGQDIKPNDANFKSISPYSFSYYTIDSTVWIYKTATYGWTKLASHRSLKFKIDSLAHLGYTKVEVNNLLTAKLNVADSLNKYVTPHQLGTVYLLKTDTINLVATKTNLSTKQNTLTNPLTQNDTISRIATKYNLSGKVDKITGKKLSTNDFSDADSLKLKNLETNFIKNNSSDTSQIASFNISGNGIIKETLGIGSVIQQKALFFGNSVTAQRNFSTPLCDSLNLIEDNRGINGTTMHDFHNRYLEIPIVIKLTKDIYKYIFFDYGINDVTSYSVVDYVANLSAAIDTTLKRGWDAKKIVIISPNYCSATALITALKPYADSAIAVAQRKGVQYTNTYYYMKNNGGASLLSDGVHPTLYGGIVMAQSILHDIVNGTGIVTYPNVPISVNVFGGINISDGIFVNNLRALTFSNYNVFNGLGSGYANTIGNYNVFNGYQSGFANTTGNSNVFNGYQSGFANTTGNSNVFNGLGSGYANTTGNSNVFNGYQSGFANTTGNYNVFNGYQSGYANTIGTYNVFNGYQSGYANTIGNYNVFNGYQSGYANTIGTYNVFNGYWAGHSNIDGSGNVFVGHRAGSVISDGSTPNTISTNSIFIGYTSFPLGNNQTNQIVIGAAALGNGSNTTTIGSSSTIRTYLPGLNLRAGSTIAGTAPLKFTSGALSITPEIGAIEFLTDAYYGTITTGAVRKQFAFTTDIHNPVTLGTGNGLSLSTQVLSLGLASESVAGAMSASDKTKLDGIATGANTGTVTSVSVITANGVSGSVVTSTTTPAITLSLGAITPTSTNGVSAATMAYNDATSSIQTQLNGKQAVGSYEVPLTFSTGLTRTGNTITNNITQYTDALARASNSFTAGSGAYNSTTGVITIPTNNNQLTNGAGYITGYTETDPTISSWAKGSSKPTYNYTEVGAAPASGGGNYIQNQNSSAQSGNIWIDGMSHTNYLVTEKSTDGGYWAGLYGGANRFLIGSNSSISGSSYNDLDIYSSYGNVYLFSGGIKKLTVNSTGIDVAGAATFSSTVAATQFVSSLGAGWYGSIYQDATTSQSVIGTPSELKIKSYNTYGGSYSSTMSFWTGSGTPSERLNISNEGIVRILSTTPSTSSTTGSLVSYGGVGIGGNLNVGGTVTASNLTSSTYTPSVISYSNATSPSVSYASYIRVGNIVHVQISGSMIATNASTSTTLSFSLPINSAIEQTGMYLGTGTVNFSSGSTKNIFVVSRTSGYSNAYFTYISNNASEQGFFSIQFDYTL